MNRTVIYLMMLLLISFMLGIAGCAMHESYLYKPGATTKTMTSDYKECKFESKKLNRNNQIVNNIADSFSRDMINHSNYKDFMFACINQKGYEWYHISYMKRVNDWNQDFYKQSLDSFFYKIMDTSEMIAYIKDGNSYHVFNHNREIKVDEECLREDAKGNPCK